MTTANEMWSLQKNPARVVAFAALNELWPDQCSGDDPALPAWADHVGIAFVFGVAIGVGLQMAVVGRHVWWTSFVRKEVRKLAPASAPSCSREGAFRAPQSGQRTWARCGVPSRSFQGGSNGRAAA